MEESGPIRFCLSDTIPPVWLSADIARRLNPLLSDSGLPESVNPEKEFFYRSELRAGDKDVTPKIIPDNDWLYGSFALVLLMIVVLRLMYPVRIKRLFRTLIFPGKGKQEERIFVFRFDIFTILFFVIYSVSFSLFTIAVIQDFGLAGGNFNENVVFLFFVFSMLFNLLLLGKLLSSRFLAAVFSTQNPSLLYQDLLLVSAFTTAALILPMIVVNVFTSSMVFLVIALFITLILLIIRIIRSIDNISPMRLFSWFHFILYFCTLEILPLMILGKIILILLNGH